MPTEIQPQYYTVGELLEKRLFRIPNFQRMYSWRTKQRSDLFGDIEKLADSNGDKDHFLSTIVCLKYEEADVIGVDYYSRYDVVDGQQRLTTLIIILRAVAKKLLTVGGDNHKQVGQDLLNQLVKADKTKLLLQTNHDNSLVFADYMEEGHIRDTTRLTTDGDLNLARAFKECEDFVERWHRERDIVELVRLVKNRMGVVFYAVTDESVVYTVFEVLNSRGLDVDWLDKVKSMLMGISYERHSQSEQLTQEHHEQLKDIWSNIFKTLADTTVPGHEVVRFAATLEYPEELRKPYGAERAYEYLEEIALSQVDGERHVSRLLENVAANLKKLDDSPRLRAVTSIAHCRLLAVAIELTQYIATEDKQELLAEWERVAFKVFGLANKDARTGVGEFTSLATRLYSGRLRQKQDVKNEMTAIADRFPIDAAIEEMKAGRDCYHEWEEELRYLLYRYEEYLCSQDGDNPAPEVWERIWRASASSTIEHIFPQEPNDDWRGRIGSGRDRTENNVHRLGNLILLPPNLNSEAGNKSFQEKKEIYRRNYLKMHDGVLSKSDWTKAEIDERDAAMWEWVRNTWG